MYRPIKFLYAALIITLIGGGVAMGLVRGSTESLPTYYSDSNPAALKTNVYAGEYRYKPDPADIKYDDNGDVLYGDGAGSVLVYPISNTSIAFYLDKTRGAPSYNMGQLYGIAIANTIPGTFQYSEIGDDYQCKFNLIFSDSGLTIVTVDDNYECGYGNGIISDDVYPKESSTVPEKYIDGQGDTYYFKDLVKMPKSASM